MENTFADAKRARHLSGCANGAGLMQLSSVAAAANAEILADNPFAQESSFINNRIDSRADSDTLPPGWRQIMHGSGLPCYVHDVLGVVCWTRPYSLNVSGDGLVSQQELYRLVQQHVPPINIFTPEVDVANRKENILSGATDVATANSSVSIHDSSSLMNDAKKRKLSATKKDQKVFGKQQSMTLEKFKTLAIGDPRVLQACMELSIKTPAQVLQEYQNRNRGVSINYNTIPVERDGVKLFKTIVSAGSTVAKGVASTKKTAKQLGAQQLLAMLHECTAKKYHEVAEMYNSTIKGQPVTTDSYVYGSTTSLLNGGRGGRSGNVDPRLQRSGMASSQIRPTYQLPLNQENATGYCEYETDRLVNAPHYRREYNQQHVSQQAIPWTVGNQHEDLRVDNVGSERVVVYSQMAASNAGNDNRRRIDMNSGNTWGSNPAVNYPPQPWNLRGGLI